VSSGPLLRGLIDTPVLLAVRRGDPDAFAFATDFRRHHQIEVSEVTAMVLLTICRDAAELHGELTFLGSCRVHRVTSPVSRRAFRILEALPPPSPLSADDAIVAATAVENKLPLYTLDPPRYTGVAGLTVLQPY
jgi:predicted nucleic acid-binding protein